MAVEDRQIAPPGSHPYDPPKAEIDPVGYALERLQAYLIWSEEHRASYLAVSVSKPGDAENEMSCLKDSIEHAILHLQRLTELVLAGHGVDSQKSLPKNLCGEVWNRLVDSITQERRGQGSGE